MATYVLIHGAWFGAWCWDSTKSLLEASGHKAIAFDLLGHGEDRTPVSEISLEKMVGAVAEVLTSQTEPVILVGHSMGGVVISQVAEAYPDRIERLIYIAAYLLQDGESLLQVANGDGGTKLAPYLLPDPDNGLIGIRPEALREVFLHDCSDEVITKAEASLRPDPIVPQATPLHLSDRNFGSVPRSYITTKLDRVVSPSLQKQMFTNLPCDRVLEIETGHSPFAAAPEKLMALLQELVP